MNFPIGPCIVQSDLSVLLEVEHPDFEKARGCLGRFAELVKSPERVHTYRITPLSLWNALATGLGKEEIITALEALSRYPIASTLKTDILEQAGRYGKLTLERDPLDSIAQAILFFPRQEEFLKKFFL